MQRGEHPPLELVTSNLAFYLTHTMTTARVHVKRFV